MRHQLATLRFAIVEIVEVKGQGVTSSYGWMLGCAKQQYWLTSYSIWITTRNSYSNWKHTTSCLHAFIPAITTVGVSITLPAQGNASACGALQMCGSVAAIYRTKQHKVKHPCAVVRNLKSTKCKSSKLCFSFTRYHSKCSPLVTNVQ